jgi:GNAT superfamily N-acetyltransferase
MTDPMIAEDWPAIETSDPAILSQIYRLRVEAWQARTSDFPTMDVWTDEFDVAGRHWVVLDGGIPVAAARLTIHSVLSEAPNAEIYRGLLPEDLAGPIGVLTRLFVARSHAGRGITRSLDIARIDAARSCGCQHVIGETFAGLPRLDQMRSLGFEVIGQAGDYRSGPLVAVKGGGSFLLPSVLHLAFESQGSSVS